MELLKELGTGLLLLDIEPTLEKNASIELDNYNEDFSNLPIILVISSKCSRLK